MFLLSIIVIVAGVIIYLNWDYSLKTLEGHSDAVSSVAYSPDGKYIISGSYDKTFKIWEASTGKCLKTLSGYSDKITSISYSFDGKYIVNATTGNKINIWEESTGKCLKTLEGYYNGYSSVSFSPNGEYVIGCSDDKTIINIWDVKSEKCIKTWDVSMEDEFAYQYDYSKSSVEYTFDGKHIVYRVFDAVSGRYINTMLEANSGKCVDIMETVGDVYSPDKKYTATIIYDIIDISNVNSGETIKTLKGHSEGVSSIAWSPDNKYIVSGSDYGIIKIWEVE